MLTSPSGDARHGPWASQSTVPTVKTSAVEGAPDEDEVPFSLTGKYSRSPMRSSHRRSKVTHIGKGPRMGFEFKKPDPLLELGFTESLGRQVLSHCRSPTSVRPPEAPSSPASLPRSSHVWHVIAARRRHRALRRGSRPRRCTQRSPRSPRGPPQLDRVRAFLRTVVWEDALHPWSVTRTGWLPCRRVLCTFWCWQSGAVQEQVCGRLQHRQRTAVGGVDTLRSRSTVPTKGHLPQQVTARP